MTNQTTTASWMHPAGACALVAGGLVFMANVAMDHSPTTERALVAGVSHPLVIISIPLGLYLLLGFKWRTAQPQSPNDGFPVLEPPPPLTAKPRTKGTATSSTRRRGYLGYVVVIGGLAVSHTVAAFIGGRTGHRVRYVPPDATAGAVRPTSSEWETVQPLPPTLAYKPITEADDVEPSATAPSVVGLGTVTAVSDHLVWISFQHPVEEWDGRKLAVERNGDPVDVMTVTRVRGSCLVADGKVHSLRTGDVLSCTLQPYLHAGR